MGATILRFPDVNKRTGLSRSTVKYLVLQGKFPSPVTLGERSLGWVESEITDWIEARIKASRESQVEVK